MLFSLLIFLLVGCCYGNNNNIDNSIVTKVADEIQNKLSLLLDDITSRKQLQTKFEKLQNENILQLNKIVAAKTINRFSQNIQRILMDYIEAVKNIKLKAEELSKTHEYDPDISERNFNYYNQKYIDKSLLKQNKQFNNLAVNFTLSTIRLPGNIYNYSKKILNGINWTNGIHEVFIKNVQKTSSLLWQYIGSDEAIYRDFPAHEYAGDLSKPDLFDCRKRLWYIYGSSSPKDGIIALDVSGSMAGNNFKIAKQTMRLLLQTFHENDFVNILYFNTSTVKFLIPCQVKLLQATQLNKDFLLAEIENIIEPHGEIDVFRGFEKAFHVLNTSTVEDIRSSGCNKMIMFISDGIEHEEKLEQTVKIYNADKKIRIFSFIVGKANFEKEMKHLATKNRGTLIKVETEGNAFGSVYEYQKFLSQPLAKHAHSFRATFTPQYVDAQGLGVMATLAAPVFNKSKHSSSDGLLGVAAVDMSIDVITDFFQKSELGVFGHAFIINNNGLFLTHPNFHFNTFLDDLSVVYLENFEYAIDHASITKVKANMIDRKTGCTVVTANRLFMTEQARAAVDNNKRVARMNFEYCHQAINDTPYILGVSIPVRGLYNLTADPKNLKLYFKDGVEALYNISSKETIFLADWLSCSVSISNLPKTLRSATIIEFKKLLSSYNDSSYKHCNQESISTLLIVASAIQKFKAQHWKEEDLLLFNGLKSLYVMLNSGFVYALSVLNNRTVSFKDDVISDNSYTHPASFNESYAAKDFYIISVPTVSSFRKPVGPMEISLSTGIKLKTQDNETALIGVVGINISSNYINNLLFNISKKNGLDCSDKKCRLIDENGYIVASNQGDIEIGKFLGMRNGLLFEKFLNLSMYQKHEFNDSQAACIKSDENLKTSSSVKLLNTFAYLLNLVSFLTQQLMYRLVNTATTNKPVYTPCVKLITIYRRVNIASMNGSISCSNSCQQQFYVSPLHDTNLDLVITYDECDGKCESKKTLNITPSEIKNIQACDLKRYYRKSEGYCYEQDEDFRYDSSASYGSSSVVTILFPVLLILLQK